MIKNLSLVMIAIFGLLVLRLLQLQVADQNKYFELALENAAKTVPAPAPRGLIFDRFGKELVGNRPVFFAQILPHILANQTPAERQRILTTLSGLTGQQLDYKVTAAEPIIIQDNLPLQAAIQIEELSRTLPGVVVSARPIRSYPYQRAAAHVLGFVGEIELRELQQLKAKGYRLHDLIGKDGVEKIYDRQLRGTDGGKIIEVDVYGNPLRILKSIEPLPGADMKLTIDLEMQLAAEQALGAQAGALVALNPKTGELLALASHPNYDPNIFADPLQNWQWQQLKYQNHPFINRGLAIYPPGSIFKVVTLSAAVKEGKASLDEIISCPGYYRLNNRIAKCWLSGGHGAISVWEGLIWSCDVVFYELGRRLGPDLLARHASAYGLGARTAVDLPQEKKGTVPDRAWKKTHLREDWFPGDSLNYGLGQGFVEVTPLQMAVLYGSLATGQRLRPYLVSEIKTKRGEVTYRATKEKVADAPVARKHLELIRSALREVVRRGTGVAAYVPGLPAAGKTGTAENPGKAHAWFVCYAPYDNPEIVIAAFVAHGEHGDRAPAYAARDLLQWYKKFRLAKKYPEEPREAQYIVHRGMKAPYRR